MARISAQIRAAENQREKSREAKMLIFEEIRMDLETREVSVEGKPVHLTPTEFAVLKTADEKSGASSDKVPDSGRYQHGHAGLYRRIA